MLDNIWVLLALSVLSSVIVSALTARYHIIKFMKITDELDKEYVDRMVEETLRLIKENKRKKNEYERNDINGYMQRFI